ncbi:MAG: hypothetical protein NVSMB5_08330 [Candidatus Velthaea sp.]
MLGLARPSGSAHRLERGQTIGFWIFGVLISLALAFFVMNYTNTIRWHVRAQNAADTAAMASVAADANISNQRTLALYAVAINEYRLRSIIISMSNAANSVGGCSPAADDSGVDCDDAYDQEPRFYDQALAKYNAAVAFLRKVDSAVPPTAAKAADGTALPPTNAPPGSSAGAAFSLAASNTNCWDVANGKKIFDCAFGYAADLSLTGPNSPGYVDVVTCRDVVATAPGIFSGPAQFEALGRAAAMLRPVSEENFSPGNTPDPGATNAVGTPPPYQPVESCPPDIASNGSKPCSISLGWLDTRPYVVDYSGLKITATFFVPQPTRPVATIPPKVCKRG